MKIIFFYLAVLICVPFSGFCYGNMGLNLSAPSQKQDSLGQPFQVWLKFESKMLGQKETDKIDGISQILSGSLALVGGIYGGTVTQDPIEKAVYTVFQSVGVASVGFGVYQWRVGGEERKLHQILKTSHWMSDEQKGLFLTTYDLESAHTTKQISNIRGLTHGLIALLNFYNGSQQQNPSVKNSLFFIGGVNAIASLSFFW